MVVVVGVVGVVGVVEMVRVEMLVGAVGVAAVVELVKQRRWRFWLKLCSGRDVLSSRTSGRTQPALRDLRDLRVYSTRRSTRTYLLV